MIIVDTNVLSEPMKAKPDQGVISWFDAQPADDLFVTAITVAELIYGVARMPNGRKRNQVAEAVGEILEINFHKRVLPFDQDAAINYGHLLAKRNTAGLPMGMADAQIAAICMNYADVCLATRNTRDFCGLDILIVNPWEESL